MPTATAKRRKGRVVAVAKKQHPAHRAVEHVVRNMRTAINEQWKLLDVPLARILPVMDSAPGVLDAVDWDRWERALGNVMLPHIQEAFAIGGLQAEAQMNVRKQDAPTLAGTFTINNPAAQRRAAQLAGELVTNASRASKLAIRDVVSRAFVDQRSIYHQKKELLRLLQGGIGLDRVRQGQLANYGTKLLDSGVSTAVWGQRMTSMRHKLLDARALTIARQEANMAVHQGMDEMWRQYADEDLIPKDAVRRWVVAYIKVCPICEPMAGQERPLGEDFVSPYNNRPYPMPPAHINCYCTVVLTDKRAKKPKPKKEPLPATLGTKPVPPPTPKTPIYTEEMWAADARKLQLKEERLLTRVRARINQYGYDNAALTEQVSAIYEAEGRWGPISLKHADMHMARQGSWGRWSGSLERLKELQRSGRVHESVMWQPLTQAEAEALITKRLRLRRRSTILTARAEALRERYVRAQWGPLEKLVKTGRDKAIWGATKTHVKNTIKKNPGYIGRVTRLRKNLKEAKAFMLRVVPKRYWDAMKGQGYRITTAWNDGSWHTRAYWSPKYSKIAMDTYSHGVIVHEHMHALEAVYVGAGNTRVYSNLAGNDHMPLLMRSVKFWEKRTAGDAWSTLKEVAASYNRTWTRVSDALTAAKRDKWGKLRMYAGKFYGRGTLKKPDASLPNRGWDASEVLTMGMEHMTTDAYAFYREDPEYFNWVLAFLRGEGP